MPQMAKRRAYDIVLGVVWSRMARAFISVVWSRMQKHLLFCHFSIISTESRPKQAELGFEEQKGLQVCSRQGLRIKEEVEYSSGGFPLNENDDFYKAKFVAPV
ncbi:uncharacterized protein LOC132638299 [Lycium barbarum]|uniref:uncharacterized protein LOC132638299 n=1 Tax=Lycium barbarum TaxID=112863 RepID=UPI00293E9EE5|nr:uncharacterized protein LOC132638299 [Lycium barbarum]